MLELRRSRDSDRPPDGDVRNRRDHARVRFLNRLTPHRRVLKQPERDDTGQHRRPERQRVPDYGRPTALQCGRTTVLRWQLEPVAAEEPRIGAS